MIKNCYNKVDVNCFEKKLTTNCQTGRGQFVVRYHIYHVPNYLCDERSFKKKNVFAIYSYPYKKRNCSILMLAIVLCISGP